MAKPASFVGTERFEIVRALGAGGMGVVYEAFDKERNVKVALKTLRHMNADALLRFKSEFRAFQDLQHPNLISLDELYSEGGVWFFTMELIQGTSFLGYVRPSPFHSNLGPLSGGWSNQPWPNPDSSAPTIEGRDRTLPGRDSDRSGWKAPPAGVLNEGRLRNGMRQLAHGLAALHESGKIHRDIKPSNVMVTTQGRVVILDFGLSTDADRRLRMSETDIVGTVEYMAPEQAAARAVGPEADWYAVGAMLHEALTGQVPLTGPTMEVLMNKQRLDAPHPKLIAPSIPDDLDGLCSDLLRFSPSARPTGRQVLERLGLKEEPSVSSQSLSSFSTSSAFVGRERELHALRECFDQVRSGARSMAVCGESGVGKSALVRRFVDQLLEREPGTVVLTGACYERESVPFKAVDGIIDALSRYMRHLPKDEAAALLPRRASLLAQVFPVLQRVEAVAEAPRAQEAAPDPLELRSRLFSALRELFVRLGDRRPLVLVVDDLQWADADSLALLAEIVREPESPHLLLIATVRRSADRSDRMVTLPGLQELTVDRLGPAEARELATLLLKRVRTPTSLKPHQIAQEAGGHPLFIDELIRHAASIGVPATSLQLEDALWERISHLDGPARTILELTCLASGRLVQQTASQAAALGFGDFAKHVQLLRIAHLLRTSGMRGTDFVEPYHGRVRAAVLGHLDAATTRSHHRRLALALETSGHPDPEALCIHWHEVGDLTRAAQFAQLAAEKATKAFAFDRAARFYELCLESTSHTDLAVADLRIKLADALANAGRSGEAGDAYLAAAEKARASETLELMRRAAEQLLISGRIDRGLATLRVVLSAAGMSLAETPKKALFRLLVSRARVRLRGLSFKERNASTIAPHALTRIDICWSAGIALGLVDSLRGADFQARNLVLSLKAGEPYRVARAIAMETAFTAIGGTPNAARATKLREEAARIAKQVANPHALGLSRLTAGIAAFLEGRWRDCRAHCAEAEEIFREHCTGVTWELDNAALYPMWARIFAGDVGDLERRASHLLRDARARGDRYLETNLRTRVFNMCFLVADRPDAGRREVEDGIAGWSQEGFHLQNYFALQSMTEIDLYEGRGAQAYDRLDAAMPLVRKSDNLLVQLMRIETFALLGRCALAAAREQPSRAPALHRVALSASKRLHGENADWATGWGHLLAGLAASDMGQIDRARGELSQAEDRFNKCGMPLHVAAIRLRTGAGEPAREWMEAQGIRSPDRMANLLVLGAR